MTEYLRPWKLSTLATGVALLIIGSFYYEIPDWDIPISLIMATLTYFTAPWSLRVILERKWRLLPTMLLASWFTVDGSYWIYWYFKAPATLDAMRSANFPASLSLYGICGAIWLYRGSLRQLLEDTRQIIQNYRGSSVRTIIASTKDRLWAYVDAKTIKPINLKHSSINAFNIYLLDAFVFNQGAIAAITILIVLIVFLPTAIYHQIKYSNGTHRFIKCLIYFSAAILVFASNHINNKIAHNRAVELIQVIEKYKQDNGSYPEKLEVLVPKYISNIPKAKFTFYGSDFRYISRPSGTMLFYTDMPPFGRQTYSFDSHKWGYLD